MLYTEKFQVFLVGDEEILWTGRPARSYFMVPSHLISILFSTIFIGVMLFSSLQSYWDMKRAWTGGDMLFLAGIAFVLAMIAFQLFRSISRYQQSYYCLTDRRIVVITEGLFPMSFSFELEKLPFASLANAGAKFGTIRFYEKGVLLKDDPDNAAHRPDLPIFHEIEDVADVFRLVQKAQGEAKEVRRAA